MYGTEFMKEYFRVIHFQNGWEDILRKHDIGWIMFDTNSVFCRHLARHPDWHLVYSDSVASIFVRRTQEYARLMAKFPAITLSQPAKDTDSNR
jgi:hypothetical protein